MFQLYANLLSVNARYAWTKIVHEQTKADPYIDFQGLTRKGPRGMSRKSFEDCVMFHLLAVFPNNAAEQERYYITNVLKKPQRISIRQFVQRVEQLNSYISQLPCWYYSPSVKANTIPMNVPFAEADLASHILQMCPYTWQEFFECVPTCGRISTTFTRKVVLRWTCARSFCLSRQSSACVAGKDPTNPTLLATRKLCTVRRRVRSGLVLTIVPESQRRYLPRNTATCARSMGARRRRTILAIAVVLRKMERKNPISALLRQAERNPIPQSSPSRS